MDFGLFTTPYSIKYPLGERSAAEVIEWDLTLATWADELGFAEVLFAEHYTIGYEPSPAPDLMVAAAAQRTERVRLGVAAHLVPYHQPANLAHRLLWLDHMTNGRYIAGFAPGSYPTDAAVFGTGKNNAEMMVEGLDIIEAIWTQKPPFKIEGKYWTCEMPEYTEQWQGPHLTPLTRPHPEVLMTGMQPQSPTFAEAARRGYSPMSQQLGNDTLLAHWEYYSAQSAEAGRTPDRRNWRVIRDYLVADTDAEARQLAIEGPMGKTWEAHILPAFRTTRARGFSKPYALGDLIIDKGMSLDELTVEWLADNFWLIGSPETVAAKVEKLNEDLGGIGCIVSLCFDHADDPAPYRRSFELMSSEVMPRVAHLGARATTTA